MTSTTCSNTQIKMKSNAYDPRGRSFHTVHHHRMLTHWQQWAGKKKMHQQCMNRLANFSNMKTISLCYGLTVAGNKSTTQPPLPPLECRGEWKETGRNLWVEIRAV